MAELATIARPYAEALYKAVPPAEASAAADQLSELAHVAGNPQLRQFADNPGALPQQVVDVITSVVRTPVGDAVRNLLLAVVDNGRLSALPEISLQYHALVNARSGVSDATLYSAFPIDDAQLAEVVASLERRFGRKLNATVAIEPELIGGIRVVVGDEVLDTSVKARLEQMRVALTA